MSPERLGKANTALRQSFDALTWEQAAAVLEELGFTCHIRYQPDGTFGAELSQIQTVAVAAAMAAAAESGGVTRERESG